MISLPEVPLGLGKSLIPLAYVCARTHPRSRSDESKEISMLRTATGTLGTEIKGTPHRGRGGIRREPAGGQGRGVRDRGHRLVRGNPRGRSRFRPVVAVLFAGAARTRGPFHLTMDCNDALEAARAFPAATSWEFTTKAGRISPRTPHPLQAEDVARCVRFALCQPAHVRIPRLMVLPGEHVI